MSDNIKIVDEFRRIKALGFIASNRSNHTGIGKTFEDYLGVTENNKKDPDFAGFEVKSQRKTSGSFITLFTKSPNHPKRANNWIKDSFGQTYEDYPELKYLHTSIFGNSFNKSNGKYGFKLNVDEVQGKLILLVKNLETNQIMSDDIYWDLSSFPPPKLKKLFVVFADTQTVGGVEHFHYTSAKVYLNFKMDRFLEGLKNGSVMLDIRIGSYKSGSKKGKAHDHGTGFRVKKDFIERLYETSFDIE